MNNFNKKRGLLSVQLCENGFIVKFEDPHLGSSKRWCFATAEALGKFIKEFYSDEKLN